MSDLVNITVDGKPLAVKKGLTVVDAAKLGDVDIPVFCHHPKLEPVGMCRMCLVDIGMPMRDRASGELMLEEDGSPKINWGRGMQTGCTVRVAEGMVVRTDTEAVDSARETVIEFLLTSHPLDCPVCDKGGECPLQNLTIAHGNGISEFDYSDKKHMEKHVPLGDLVFLDRERCIQCARCVRFQDEVVDDPVLGFHNRGRSLEIVTNSNPGFDSYWSGNTTDICPVGALTTSDFRFGARPWEMTTIPSVSPHGPVGENIAMSIRQEAKSGGRVVIKRIMPRQNERVNEIWISDKTRFAHHFADSADRLTTPLVRKGGVLVEASWDDALTIVSEKLQAAGSAVAGLSGERPSNEDMFAFQQLFRKDLKSGNVDLANGRLAGGDVTAQIGIAKDSNLGELGSGDAILVFASDLLEEAPVWWLRVKQAAERGAKLVVANLRGTRLDKYASHAIHYGASEALSTARQLLDAARISDSGDDLLKSAAETLLNASNVVAFYGYEGLSYDETDVLAKTLGNLLLMKNEAGENHVGRVNNGLVAVWPHNNTQGAWDMGINPNLEPGYKATKNAGLGASATYAGVKNGDVKALYVMAADPIGDGLMSGRGSLDFLVVQELFMTETAKEADVVLPAQSWAERDGTFTSGERRIQRYYPAIAPVGSSRPDWQILQHVAEKVSGSKPAFAAAVLFKKNIGKLKTHKKLDYRSLSQNEEQWPIIGKDDLYYGGTSYENQHGLGVQLASAAESGNVNMYELLDVSAEKQSGLPLVRTASLYTPGTLINYSDVLAPRMAQPTLYLSENVASDKGINMGDSVSVKINGASITASAYVNGVAPDGVALISGVPYQSGIIEAEIEKA